MKKILTLVALLSLVTSLGFAAGKKGPKCHEKKGMKCENCCPGKIKGVASDEKNTATGIEITLTAKDASTVTKVREAAKTHYGADAKCPCVIAGAKNELSDIEGGIKIAITGTTPEMIKQIQESCAKCKAGKMEVKKHKYSCPMGCAHSEKPVKCPKCGMEMKKN